MAGPMVSLRRSMGDKLPVRQTVVHRKSATTPTTTGLSPGVEALDVQAFVAALSKRPTKSRAEHT
jgi:hypothetical protein